LAILNKSEESGNNLVFPGFLGILHLSVDTLTHAKEQSRKVIAKIIKSNKEYKAFFSANLCVSAALREKRPENVSTTFEDL